MTPEERIATRNNMTPEERIATCKRLKALFGADSVVFESENRSGYAIYCVAMLDYNLRIEVEQWRDLVSGQLKEVCHGGAEVNPYLVLHRSEELVSTLQKVCEIKRSMVR